MMNDKQREERLRELIGSDEFDGLTQDEKEVLLASFEADVDPDEKLPAESRGAVFAHLDSGHGGASRREGWVRLYYSIGSAAAVAALFLLFFPLKEIEVKEKPVTKKEYITVVDTVEETIRDTVYVDRIRYIEKESSSQPFARSSSDPAIYETTVSVIPVPDITTLDQKKHGRSLANDSQPKFLDQRLLGDLFHFSGLHSVDGQALDGISN